MQSTVHIHTIKFIAIILMVSASTNLYSQEIRSNKVEFLLSNLRDSLPPTIRINAPDIIEKHWYQTNVDVIDLIGVVADDDRVRFVAVNSKKTAINDSGIFTSRIELFPGRNEVRLVASDVKNNLQELFIFIDYEPL